MKNPLYKLKSYFSSPKFANKKKSYHAHTNLNIMFLYRVLGSNAYCDSSRCVHLIEVLDFNVHLGCGPLVSGNFFKKKV